MPNLLVEIGTEELPTDALSVVYSNLAAKATETFQKNRLSFKQVWVQATPRRIAFYIEDLAVRQQDENLELSGPSVEKAYDAEGKPSQALLGFLKSKEAELRDLEVKDTPRGQFVVIRRALKGKPAVSVLPEVLAELFNSLTFPKNMRWEKSGFRFPRPIRWLVALLDKKVLNFTFCGLKAGSTSYGHRFLSPKSFKVLSADWALYQKTLAKAHVILDLDERKELIAKELRTRFKQNDFDEELLHMSAQLVEEPFLLEGSFKKEYLELPKEVLASCMKKNQKIFACKDSAGKLTGKFVAILNGARAKAGLPRIREDYEGVLESRLKDARYFYKEDTKEKFETKLHLLEQVTYLGKLGNMRQKAERLEKFSLEFADFAGHAGMQADLARAARLSKIDLMTHLVYEFPDLQGIVGREYSRESGEKKEVAEAVGSQYLPKSLSENYQDLKKDMNFLGAMLGVADRLDHLVGAFGTGVQVSGSQDPYALRRAGGSLVKIIRTFNIHFSLDRILKLSMDLYGSHLTLNPEELKAKLVKFMEERVIFELQVKPGTKDYEILLAVMKTSADNLSEVFDRFEKLQALFHKDPKPFLKAAKVVERTGNIIKGAKIEGEMDPAVFVEPSEKVLMNILSGKIWELEAIKDPAKYTVRFGEIFYDAVQEFFSQVMVNAEDTSIRRSRQILMKTINGLYTQKIADLSLLSSLDSV